MLKLLTYFLKTARMKVLFVFMLSIGLVFLNKEASSKDGEIMKMMKSISIALPDTVGETMQDIQIPDEDLNDVFEANLDSLVNSMYLQNVFVPDSVEVNFADYNGNLLPDSVYIRQLQEVETVVDLSFNEVVKKFIQLYTVRRREQVEIMLGLSTHYFPMFEEALDRYELPLELKFLPIIESALNPIARSRVGASGLWQFMYNTAKLMNLEVSSFVDERRDPLKSTDAAARYLKQLYDIYQDWQLVIAAYNCGPGNVNRAIKRSGGKKDYWSIYYKLPRETRQYVPAYIAATYVMDYFPEHHLVPRIPEFPVVTDTIMINHLLHFNQITANIDINIEQLRLLNPMYRRDIIPGKKDRSYALRLPVEKIAAYVSREDSIYSYDREKYFPNNTLVQPSGSTAYYYAPSDIKGKVKIMYTVKSGDNIGFISDKFKVKAADIRYWNNISRNLIRVGQKLAIYIPESQKGNFEQANEIPVEQKQKAVKQSAARDEKTVAQQPESENGEYVYYTVRRGDNFWTIAQKFPGVSNFDIMQLNNIDDAGSLKIGQKLKIKPKA
jgi:membrane-bound lytic murein transglycosylase D